MGAVKTKYKPKQQNLVKLKEYINKLDNKILKKLLL